MSFELSIADDFLNIVDWLKPATVEGEEIAKTLRREISIKEVEASGGLALMSDSIFHFSVDDYPSTPAVGTPIVDDDGTWTILQVQKQTLANRWRCIVRQLSIEATNTVSIQRATYAKGVTGAEEATFSTIASNVVCRIQRDTTTVDVEHTNRTATTTAKAFFLSAYPLQAGDRIIGPTGIVHKVLSWNGFDPVDQFFTANCEVSKWPQS